MVVNCLTQVLEAELSSPEGHLVILTAEPSLWPQYFLLINKSESVLSGVKNEKILRTFSMLEVEPRPQALYHCF